MDDKSQILVVDHEPEWRAFTKAVLDAEGYAVQDSGDTQSALEIIADDGFDLIIVDALSEILFKSLATGYKRYRLLVFTTAPSVPEAIKVYRYGALDYISKSFDSANLVNDVAIALQKQPVQEIIAG
jgi:DNA-binding NtrC family response regulator